ncbi:MAG: hypothetical protein GVY32_08385 [Gammaproteobacteria bacterium]|jgi:hypothetical protein|nr:hypothetical protein [Gammaproteobacteria bacterium]
MLDAAAGRRCACGLLVAMLLGASPAQAAERYMIEMALWIEGSKRGEPMLIVEPGEPAEISSTDPEGENGWRIELEVEPPAPIDGGAGGAIWLHLSIHRLVDGNWQYLTHSMLGVPEGESNTLSVASGDGESGRDDALVHLTAVLSRLQPADG